MNEVHDRREYWKRETVRRSRDEEISAKLDLRHSEARCWPKELPALPRPSTLVHSPGRQECSSINSYAAPRSPVFPLFAACRRSIPLRRSALRRSAPRCTRALLSMFSLRRCPSRIGPFRRASFLRSVSTRFLRFVSHGSLVEITAVRHT